MKETEITVQVFNTKEEIIEKLATCGFKISNRFTLKDGYFSRHTDITGLSYKELMVSSILIRRVITNEATRDFLYYKNKSYDENGVVTSEEKISLEIEEASDAKKIFLSAGLNCWCELENRSIVFDDGSRNLALQIIPNLGLFFEVEEFDEIKTLSPAEKIEKLKSFINSFGFNLGSDYSCKKQYMMLHKTKIN